MPMMRETFDLTLDALAAAMPRLLAAAEERQSDSVARLVEDILEAAGPEDRDHVRFRLRCIQQEAGLIPSYGNDPWDARE